MDCRLGCLERWHRLLRVQLKREVGRHFYLVAAAIREVLNLLSVILLGSVFETAHGVERFLVVLIQVDNMILSQVWLIVVRFETIHLDGE